MAGLISEALNVSLNNLIGKANTINRLLDRQMSLLSNKFLMKNASKLLHPRHAHFFSLVMADLIGDYQDKRSNLTEYPGTEDEVGRRDYQFPRELFNDSLMMIIEFENMIHDAIEIAIEEGDYTTKQFLNELLEKLIEDIDLAQTMAEMSKLWGDAPQSWLAFDANINKYISDKTLPEVDGD